MDPGAQLREARRQRKLTLGEVANRTKIPIHTLEAIERNELDRLPRGIFTRGFLRGYAAEVGLDPEQIVNECFPPLVIEAPAEAPETPTHAVNGQWGMNGVLVAAAIGLVVAIGVYNLRSRKPPAQPVVASVPLHLDGTVSTLPEIPVSRFSSVMASIRPGLQVSGANIAAQPNAGNKPSLGTETRPEPTSGLVPALNTVPNTTETGAPPSAPSVPAPSPGTPPNGASPENATPNQPPPPEGATGSLMDCKHSGIVRFMCGLRFRDDCDGRPFGPQAGRAHGKAAFRPCRAAAATTSEGRGPQRGTRAGVPSRGAARAGVGVGPREH